MTALYTTLPLALAAWSGGRIFLNWRLGPGHGLLRRGLLEAPLAIASALMAQQLLGSSRFAASLNTPWKSSVALVGLAIALQMIPLALGAKARRPWAERPSPETA